MQLTRLMWISTVLASSTLVAGGCASRPTEPDRVYAPRSDVLVARAPVLAFDPVVSSYAPPVDLSRDGRGQAAFVGFDSFVTYTYTRMDDRQSFYGSTGHFRGSNSAVERQTVTQTFGVRER